MLGSKFLLLSYFYTGQLVFALHKHEGKERERRKRGDYIFLFSWVNGRGERDLKSGGRIEGGGRRQEDLKDKGND